MRKKTGLILLSILITLFLVFTACSVAEPTNPFYLMPTTNMTGLSHTLLTDIGINTHPLIDTHLSSTAAHGTTGANVGTTNTQELTNKTLNASIAKGTWTTSGTWTIPMHTLAGAISCAGQGISNPGYIAMGSGTYIGSVVADSSNYYMLTGGYYTGASGATYFIFGKNLTGGSTEIWTPNAALTVSQRFQLAGGTDIIDATWVNVKQVGMNIKNFLTFNEVTSPGAGAIDTARIYAVADADNLTDLAAVFQDGTVDIFAQEMTPLDSPILIKPTNSIVTIVMIKPHPGLIKFVMRFIDGQEITLKEIEYHTPEKIAANINCISNKLPLNWLVETQTQRLARLEAELEAEKAKFNGNKFKKEE